MGILVLGIPEEFVLSAELCDERGGGDSTVVDRTMRNVQEEITKCGEEGGRVRGDRGSCIGVLSVDVCGSVGVCLWVWSCMCCPGATLVGSSCGLGMICRLGRWHVGGGCCGLGCCGVLYGWWWVEIGAIGGVANEFAERGTKVQGLQHRICITRFEANRK